MSRIIALAISISVAFTSISVYADEINEYTAEVSNEPVIGSSVAVNTFSTVAGSYSAMTDVTEENVRTLQEYLKKLKKGRHTLLIKVKGSDIPVRVDSHILYQNNSITQEIEMSMFMI